MTRKMDTREEPESANSEKQPLAKQEQLFAQLRSLESVLVAFSGGADSAYLAWAAHRTLGERALAVTALSPSFSAHDRALASQFVAQTGMRHEFIETSEFENPLYVANNANRCYFCKKELFDKMQELCAARGFAAIAYGANTDDMHDFRPGHRAAFENDVLVSAGRSGPWQARNSRTFKTRGAFDVGPPIVALSFFAYSLRHARDDRESFAR